MVKLNSAINSTSITEAATPKAVKTVYDHANTKLPFTGGQLSGTLTVPNFTLKSGGRRYISWTDEQNNQDGSFYKDKKGSFVFSHLANNRETAHQLSFNPYGYLSLSGNTNIFPIGAPIPWPTHTPPPGWLKCNGERFDKNQYPELARAYPSGVLPDLRGEFIRGWSDNRKNVDENRTLLTYQTSQESNHFHCLRTYGSNNGVFSSTNSANAYNNNTPPSVINPTGTFWNGSGGGGAHSSAWPRTGAVIITGLNQKDTSENYPRNIAFLYIVRAA